MTAITKDFDFNKVFSAEKSILSTFGLFPTTDRLRLSDFVIKIIIVVLTIIHTGSIVMVIRFDSVRSVLEPSILVITTVAYIVKLVCFLAGGKEILRCEELLRRSTFQIVPENILEKVNKSTREVVVLGHFYRCCCFGYIVVNFTMGCIEINNWLLPVNSWWPFDFHNYYAYFSIAIFQAVAIWQTAFSNSGMDLIFYKLATILYCQLDILIENLKSIDYSDNEKDIKEKLRLYVMHHYELIEFFNNVDTVYSRIAVVQCCTSLLTICSGGFQAMVMVPVGSVEFWVVIDFFAIVTFSMGFYCWYGHKVGEKSIEINDACYATNWYESTTSVKKILFIFMERTKEPLVFKAGGFIMLSLATFGKILRSSYSYMAVLQRLYKQ